MPQFGVLAYLPAPADPGSLPPEYLEQIDRYPALAKELGGKVLGGFYFARERGFAFGPTTAATAIRGDILREGPLVEADLVVAAVFVLSAPDMETAVRVAGLHPAARAGGVEVRPLFTPPAG